MLKNITPQEERNTSQNFVMIAVFLIMTGSVVFELYEFIPALILSLLLWFIFSYVLEDIIFTMKKRKSILEKGGDLYQYCSNCRSIDDFDISETSCPDCGEPITAK